MKTIVINNQKGGVGKTMLAVHLAWFLAEKKTENDRSTRVLVIDLDGQGNASKVLSGEHEAGAAADLFDPVKELPAAAVSGISVMAMDERIHGIEMASVPQAIRRFQAFDGYDYCVIDTPPTWGARNFTALAISDYLISPIEMKDFAMDGVRALLGAVDAVEKRARGGRELINLGFLPSRFNSHSKDERVMLQNTLDALGATLMFPGVLTVRDNYEFALRNKLPVWRLPASSSVKEATKEMHRVMEKVWTRIEGSPA